MNTITFRAYSEFNRALLIEREISTQAVRLAEDTLKRAYKENENQPIHFPCVYCEDKSGDYLGEFTTLDCSGGLKLYGEKDGDGFLTDISEIRHEHLEELVNAVVNALEK